MANPALINDFEMRYQKLMILLRRLPISVWQNVLIAFALVWMCGSVAQLVWLLIPSPEVPQPKVLAVQSVGDDAPISGYSVDLSALQSHQLFGEAVAGAAIEPESTAAIAPNINENNVEKTALNLKLVGLLASSTNEEAAAIIAQGADQKIYQIGDKLPAGNSVTLAKVLTDRVILNNNGNYEALWLYSENDFAVSYSRPVSRSAPAEPRRQEQVISASIKPSEVPESISDVVRFSVHREEGKMVGFRLRPSRNRELFTRLGLQANDIVTSVNGVAIDSPQAIRDHYQQLKTASVADLEIKRGDERLFINISLDSISE